MHEGDAPREKWRRGGAAMVAWGDRWTAGDAGPPVLYRHRSCGQVTHVEPHCAACGEILRSTDVEVEPGPGLAAASDRGELSAR